MLRDYLKIMSKSVSVQVNLDNHVNIQILNTALKFPDMSGGYGHSLMDAMRQALSVSICISFNKEGYKPLDFKNVFFLATLGGAQGKKCKTKF
jgi:hypothetical protein